jgi:alpha-mannosidase
LTTHKKAFDAAEAMRFSLEHQNPLVANWVEGDADADKQNTFSLLSVSDPSLFLWSVKPSEEGIEKGLITRFWNMNTQPIRPTITLKYPLSKAAKTTHIETDERELFPVKNTLTVDFKQHQLNTYRLIFR